MNAWRGWWASAIVVGLALSGLACSSSSSSNSQNSCTSICPGVVAAKCAGGPPDEASCESGCGQEQSKCPNEFAALAICAGSPVHVTCDATGFPVPTGCTSQSDALRACFAK